MSSVIAQDIQYLRLIRKNNTLPKSTAVCFNDSYLEFDFNLILKNAEITNAVVV